MVVWDFTFHHCTSNRVTACLIVCMYRVEAQGVADVARLTLDDLSLTWHSQGHKGMTLVIALNIDKTYGKIEAYKIQT